jgi:hypothetical protein
MSFLAKMAGSPLLTRYKPIREVRFALNSRLVKTISKETLEDSARELGLFHRGSIVLDSEDQMSILMDQCLYRPQPDGRNLVAKYLEETPPTPDSEEMAVLLTMTQAYYSLFQITDVQKGVGITVQDLLRREPGFIVDVGLGNTADKHFLLASRIVPSEDFLMTNGAAIPGDARVAKRAFQELARAKMDRQTFDFHGMTTFQQAELSALLIRSCLSLGMTSHVQYAEPGAPARLPSERLETPLAGRNERCPCGSGKKYKLCCGRR